MQDLSNFSINGVSCPMVFVQPGSFQTEGGENIHFEKGFYIGKYPVTQILWQTVMGKKPSSFKGKNFPVESINWDDICQENGFLNKLNSLETVKKVIHQDGLKFRLPSEAMWEFAARGGNHTKGCKFSGSHKLTEVGWFDENSYGEIKEVGLKLPNELGLYDMSGNVWEWCADFYREDYQNLPKDGSAWLGSKQETRRVVRGGSWFGYDFSCTVFNHFGDDVSIKSMSVGFRLTRY